MKTIHSTGCEVDEAGLAPQPKIVAIVVLALVLTISGILWALTRWIGI